MDRPAPAGVPAGLQHAEGDAADDGLRVLADEEVAEAEGEVLAADRAVAVPVEAVEYLGCSRVGLTRSGEGH